MNKLIIFLITFFFTTTVFAQNLPCQLEELTAPDFVMAVEESSKTCILPIGVLEKHGPHLPLGTDVYLAREYALRASKQDYTVVFPMYYFSQINEARHQPGTVAYSPKLIWEILQETLDELNRNGFEKIIIVNGHGGNNSFLNFFGMAQLNEHRKYALYLFQPKGNAEVARKVEELTQVDKYDSHAGNSETSSMVAAQPNLTHPERASKQSGVDIDRMKHLDYLYSGIWWYASYPNHYGGDGSKANAEAGELLINERVKQLVEMIKMVKADTSVTDLQNQFFREAENPLKTKQ